MMISWGSPKKYFEDIRVQIIGLYTTYLIIFIVKKSLQGDIELVNDNGAMVRITFPLMVPESENRGSVDE